MPIPPKKMPVDRSGDGTGPRGNYYVSPVAPMPDAWRAEKFISPDLSISHYDDDFVRMDAEIRSRLKSNLGGHDRLADQNARWAKIYRELPQVRLNNALALLQRAETKVKNVDYLTKPEPPNKVMVGNPPRPLQGRNRTTVDPDLYKRASWSNIPWAERAAYYWKHGACAWGLSAKEGLPEGLPILGDADANKLFPMRLAGIAVPPGHVASALQLAAPPASTTRTGGGGHTAAFREYEAALADFPAGESGYDRVVRLRDKATELNTRHGLVPYAPGVPVERIRIVPPDMTGSSITLAKLAIRDHLGAGTRTGKLALRAPAGFVEGYGGQETEHHTPAQVDAMQNNLTRSQGVFNKGPNKPPPKRAA